MAAGPRLTGGPLLALSAAALVSCTQPGPRARGTGEASWGGQAGTSWSGTCLYEVHTRWSTRLPHTMELTAEGSDWSIVVSGPRRFPSGSTPLSRAGEGGIQGLVLEGSTARGAVLGTLQLSRRGDSTYVHIGGTKQYRDTVPLRAACRLGPL